MRDRHQLEALRLALTRGLVLIGLGALAVAGGAALKLALAGLAGVAAGWALRGQPAHVEAWRVASALVSVATLLVPMLFEVPWALAGAGLLVYLQVHRARVGREAADDRRSLLFALLMVLLATGGAQAPPALGLLLLAMVMLLPAALLVLNLWEQEAAHAVRRVALGADGRRWALLALGPASLALTALFFTLIPRLNAEVLAQLGEEPQDIAGFNDSVELGEIGEIKENDALVLRAWIADHRGEAQRGPFYFRGIALNHFDGAAWSSTDRLSTPISVTPPTLDDGKTGVGQLRQRVVMEAWAGDGSAGIPLFAAGRVERVISSERVWGDGLSGLRFDREPRRREYSVLAAQTEAPPRSNDPGREAALQLPDSLDPRILELAGQVVGETQGDWSKAALIETWLNQDFEYTLQAQQSEREQALATFLFETRRGHCEYFATALAVLLRAEGVPARLVSGFYSDEYNPVGGFVAVRQLHAHTWVEAWLDGRWVSLDATPAGALPDTPSPLAMLIDAMEARWYGSIVNYDLSMQIDGARRVGSSVVKVGGGDVDTPAAPAVGVAVLVLATAGALMVVGRLVARLLVRRRRRSRGPVEGFHARARRLVRRRGYRIPMALPPVEAATWLVDRAGAPAEPLLELAWLHYRVRYASEPGGGGVQQRAQACLKALDELPRMTQTQTAALLFLAGVAVGAGVIWLSPSGGPGDDGGPILPADGAVITDGLPEHPPGHVPEHGPEEKREGPAPGEPGWEEVHKEVPIEVPALEPPEDLPVPEPIGKAGPTVPLDIHYAEAEPRWKALRKELGRTWHPRVDALLALAPSKEASKPLLQDVVAFLVQEHLLLEDLLEAGVDVQEALDTLDALLQAPAGQVKGGADKAVHKGGAGKAPEGTRPLNPDVPRRTGER